MSDGGLLSESRVACRLWEDKAMHVPLHLDAEEPSFVASQLSRWVDEVLGPDYQRYRADHAWSPSINLYEDSRGFCLVADLAGVAAEGIDLQVEEGQLVLRGDRPVPRPPQCEVEEDPKATGPNKLHLMEIDHGPFLRKLRLPENVDVDGIEACYRNGFLWVRMPRKS